MLLKNPASANQSHLRNQDLNQGAAERMLARLKDDIQSCVDCDQVYSPVADAKRQQIGKAAVTHTRLRDHMGCIWDCKSFQVMHEGKKACV